MSSTATAPAAGAPPAHHPQHGYTKRGHAVHGHTKDHLPAATGYQRFNKRAAVWITDKVGTMTCCWLFCVLACLSLPAVLTDANIIPASALPAVLTRASTIALISWVAQTFIQLVLLPAIMVGQNVQSEAADARAAKTFEDVEMLLDKLDMKVQGGMRQLHDELIAAIDAIKQAT
ncbi:MAG TPA: hypothetical protein VL977_07835 [Solirubrobacteraceae bacterium]|nr:hypothetical protein [Solirubrobacteraceae bacterium]